MKHTPQKTPGRTKDRVNAYLNKELRAWGESHAAKAFKTARKPKGETLSFLVEKLLLIEKRKVDRKAARRAAMNTRRA